MTARHRIAVTALLTAVAACESPNPVGFDDTGRAQPPEAPTDTSGFMTDMEGM